MLLHLSLNWLDKVILGLYCLFVLGIGWRLKRQMRTSDDFFLSGRRIPSWITGLAFLSANLGALEMMGMAASGAKYGMLTSHFYWIGAVPAMIFVALFMMPFYYGSKARSVPEYLRLRFDEKTRALNAFTFAIMTVLMSGISLYAMAILFRDLLGWSFDLSIWLSAGIVLLYTASGGLTSSIYNEVLQFFLIVLGFTPLTWLGLREAGGWHGLQGRLLAMGDRGYLHLWQNMAHPSSNPMGVEWFGLVMGLGFVLSFGYWCTDFLVVQRAMAAEDMAAARRTPLIAAVPKMLFPFIVIVPGILALALIPAAHWPLQKGAINFNEALPLMIQQFYPAGMLGLGLTALLASFMSGMAGNVTAFNSVWTYDIYQSYIKRDGSDAHYLAVGRWTTIIGIVLSVGGAYLVTHFDNLMDYMQLVFGFVNAPLFATFLLGMFWKRSTGHGAFWGLLSGMFGAAAHYSLTVAEGKGGWIAHLHTYSSSMAQNFWGAIWAFVACFAVTVMVSLASAPRPEAELAGLVRSLTPRLEEKHLAWFRRPAYLGVGVLVILVALNWYFR
ncbi:MAG TPA: sodium:solute symporter family protein [Terriglobales bacterium]|nr:sodium:solute symporter family protein [Terriglobales bacterium]